MRLSKVKPASLAFCAVLWCCASAANAETSDNGQPMDRCPANVVVPSMHSTQQGDIDDAQRLQRAIVIAERCGAAVLLGPGVFRLRTPIVVHSAITLRGTGWQESREAAGGTWLEIDQKAKSAITVTGPAAVGTTVEDVAFTESQPDPNEKYWEPKEFPFSIDVKAVPGTVNIINTYWPGITNGVRFYLSGRGHILKMHGQFFKTGLFMDKSYDTPYIEDVRDWPYWSAKENVIQYTQANSNFIVLGRVDTPFIGNVFVFSARSAITLEETGDDSDGNKGGPTTGATINNLSCDGVDLCLNIKGGYHTAQISNINGGAQMGVSSAKALLNSALISFGDSGSGIIQIGRAFGSYYSAPIFDHNLKSCSVITIGMSYFNDSLSLSLQRDLLDILMILYAGRLVSIMSFISVFGLRLREYKKV